MIRRNRSLYVSGLGMLAITGLCSVAEFWGKAIAQPPVAHPVQKLFAVSQATPPLTDTTIEPGQRVGPITPQTSYAALVKLFGAERLTDVRPPDADDTEREFGTRINLGPDWSLTLVWQDKTKMKPYEAIDLGPGWQIPGGLRVGMSIAEVQQKLGVFQMVGLGGPYGGIVPLTNTALQQYFGKIIVQMGPVPDATSKLPQQYKAVEGERLIPSTDPNWQALGMRVKYLIVLFPR